MAAHQALLSLGFSRQEYWNGLPFHSQMDESEKRKWTCSVVSDSLRPYGLQPTRLLCQWDFPGKSPRMGCHCLLWILYFSGCYILVLLIEIFVYEGYCVNHTFALMFWKENDLVKLSQSVTAHDVRHCFKSSAKSICTMLVWQLGTSDNMLALSDKNKVFTHQHTSEPAHEIWLIFLQYE